MVEKSTAPNASKKDPKGESIIKDGLNRLGRWFTNDPTPSNGTPATAQAAQTAPPVAQASTSSEVPQSKTGVVNKEIRAKLWEALAKKNKSGLDFFEFNKALDGDKVTVRDTDKYKKVYEFMQTMYEGDAHTLRTVLIESGGFYLSVLDQEKLDFEVDYKDEVDLRIGKQRNEAGQIISDVAELERQKADIDQKLQERKARLGDLQDEIAKEEISLERQRNDFLVTFDDSYKEISSKIENIKHYIPEGATTTEAAANQ